ncbi:MAG TPA: DUF559 domain-containing protein [Candidatus Binatia bacterium]|nr:DUF559 domain-containing protein [Candidatus Binatia bacterium]
MSRARLLRHKATEAERTLWRHLRNRNFAGYKFRRQHPVDPYVLDFYCAAAKLAIEGDRNSLLVGELNSPYRRARTFPGEIDLDQFESRLGLRSLALSKM